MLRAALESTLVLRDVALGVGVRESELGAADDRVEVGCVRMAAGPATRLDDEAGKLAPARDPPQFERSSEELDVPARVVPFTPSRPSPYERVDVAPTSAERVRAEGASELEREFQLEADGCERYGAE